MSTSSETSFTRPMRRAAVILTVAWAAFTGYVIYSSGELPARVATHFGAAGQANGWMTRSGQMQFTLVMGLVIPAFVLGLFYVIGRFPEKWLNIADKEYWLAPERRDQTITFVQVQGMRFATTFLGLLTAVHWSTVAANRHDPPSLPASQVAWIAGLFLAANVVWAIVFVRRFIRRPS